MSKYVSTSLRGYHRSRIDTGFAMHARKDWQAERTAWQQANPVESERESAKCEEVMNGLREAYDKMIEALAQPPAKT